MTSRISVVFFAAGVMTASLFGQTSRSPYKVVEVDGFASGRGVKFPSDYQTALVEDIVQDLKDQSKGTEVIREGEKTAGGGAVMRISGIVTEFQPGSRAVRLVVGLGAGETVIKAHVSFTDVASGKVLAEKDLTGRVWLGGVWGGSSEGAADHIGNEIVSAAISHQFVADMSGQVLSQIKVQFEFCGKRRSSPSAIGFHQGQELRSREPIIGGAFDIPSIEGTTVDVHVRFLGRALVFPGVPVKRLVEGTWIIGVDRPPFQPENASSSAASSNPGEVWFIDFKPLAGDGTRVVVASPASPRK